MQPRAYLPSPVLLSLFLAAPLWLLVGCANSNYCEGHVNNDCREELLAEPGCMMSGCDDPMKSVCNEAAAPPTCVACLNGNNETCGGTTPICRDLKCEKCDKHSECASEVCLSDGSCAAEDQIAYVEAQPATNAGTQCTKSAPCQSIADARGTGKEILRIKGSFDERVSVSSGNLKIIGVGSSELAPKGMGPILGVQGNSKVELIDVRLRGSDGDGISINSDENPFVSLTRVTISDNKKTGIKIVEGGGLRLFQTTVERNESGGISISGGTFQIINSFIVDNGGANPATGGLYLHLISQPGEIVFTTIAGNRSTSLFTPGIHCSDVGTPVRLSSSIVYGNTSSGINAQVPMGSCATWDHTIIGPQTVNGASNEDPLFKDIDGGDFHLQALSPAKDKANQSMKQERDIDDQKRDAMNDIGADEVM